MSKKKKNEATFNRGSGNSPLVKSPPQHSTRGTPCDIVENCTSGKPALYIAAGKFACIEHRDLAYQKAKTHRHSAPLPNIDRFEPEIETVEAEEVEVGHFISIPQGTVD